MRCLQLGDRWLLRFEKGEEVIDGLRRFVRSAGIPGGILGGIGAADEMTVAFWDTVEKKYRDYLHRGLIEITSLSGNIAWAGSEPVVHLHVSAYHETEGGFGGHLVSARVSATVEVSLDAYPSRVERLKDAEIGLALLDLPPLDRA